MIPCEQCLMLVLCKRKKFGVLVRSCSIVRNYYYLRGAAVHQERVPNFDEELCRLDLLFGTMYRIHLISREIRGPIMRKLVMERVNANTM